MLGKHQLRSAVRDFVGREIEIEALKEELRAGGRVGISGISGMGGIGKTELALVVAHELTADYPDAQLFVEMRGTDPEPRDPADALAYCIRAFVGLDTRLPGNLDQLNAIYCDQLSDKRALIVLDNVADERQAMPLVPPHGCALIMTSREMIPLPGMKRIKLEELEPERARELLVSLVTHTALDSKVADRICTLCGYLPLAIRAAGSLLDVTVDLNPADYADQLRDEGKRLEHFGKRGVNITVEASFNLSYERLEMETAEVFHKLAVFPVTFDAAAEAFVCEDTNHERLSDLVRRSLVIYDDEEKRYRLHDLMRLFADARLTEAERANASKRHALYYKDVLYAAHNLYLEGNDAIKRGLALFDAEWINIQAGRSWAETMFEAEAEAAQLCIDYPDAGTYLFSLRQHPRERIQWLKVAVTSDQRLKQQDSEGNALGNLGNAHAILGEYHKAIEFYEQALVIDREMNDRTGEGIALGNIGVAYRNLGEPRKAIEFFEQALVIDREVGYRRGEGNSFNNLGLAYTDLGEFRKAIEFFEQSLVIKREIGYRRGVGNSLGNLGIAYHALGETHRAIEFLEQQLAIVRDMNDHQGEGNALWNKAVALNKLGDRPQAIACAEASLEIFEKIESSKAEEVRNRLAEWRGEK